jgi:hypothetical protein
MERVKILQDKIKSVMDSYLFQLQQPTNQHITFELIADKDKNHYQIIALGWEQNKRIFNLLFHLDIIGDKIWVQEDKMEQSIAEMLVENGVSKKDIVLAYFPEFHRKHTEFAVA